MMLNCIFLIGTYDKKAAQVVSENIGGPGYRWVRKMNARNQKNCIINSGEEKKKVAQRMEAATERRNMQGRKGNFLLLLMQRRSLKSFRCHMRMELPLAGNTPGT